MRFSTFLFIANASGTGQGAISNQDGTPNSAQKPAAKGSVITLYATGEGLDSPPGVDGGVAVSPYPKPVLPVSVTIDGQPAMVPYAGAAPGEVIGVLQVSVTVPANARSGIVPVTLIVDHAKSQDVVTLAIE